MPQQARLDVLFYERLTEQRIIEEINLPDAKIIRGAPIALHLVQQLRRKRPIRLHAGRLGLSALRFLVDFYCRR